MANKLNGKWIKIFHTGTHKAMSGIEKTYTEEDLDKIVSLFSADAKPPVVIGHPKTDDPAYGWVGEVKRVGKALYAKLTDVVDEFAEVVLEKKMFQNRSSALNEDMSLRHVGFLGAVPPAVKGLGGLQFAESDAVDYFEDSDVSDEYADLIAEKETLQFELNASKEKEAALFADKQAAEAELSRIRMQRWSLDQKAFLNEQIAFGNILPAWEEPIMRTLEVLNSAQFVEENNEQVYCFADGKKANPVNTFVTFLKGLPKIMEFAEVAKKPDEKQAAPRSSVEIIVNEINKK